VPPLDYGLVHDIKAAFPGLHISVNGGVETLGAACEFLDAGLDGVMVGRAAYNDPATLLADVDRRVFGADAGVPDPALAAVQAMLPYIERHVTQGGRLHQVTRHMLGLFTGRPGARAWRRHLSQEAHRDGAGPEVVLAALSAMAPGARAAE